MDEPGFQPVFDYIDKAFLELKEGLLSEVATKADIQKLQDSLDALIFQMNK